MDESDLTYSGTGDLPLGDGSEDHDDLTLPGGITPEVAAYGSGGLGALLMGLTGWLRRRRTAGRVGADD